MTINLMMGETYLKQASVINDNVDMKVLTPIIEDVQRNYIEDILGTQLYAQILSQIGSGTVSANNQTLLNNYILPCMKYYVLYEAAPVLKWRYMNKGVMVKNSENSSPAEDESLLRLMDWWKNKAEKAAEKLTRYLEDNTSTYTLFLNNTEPYENQPNKTNFSNGLFLDDGNEDIPCWLRGRR